ncbi:FOG: Leucine rich repeat [Plasmopara halstedii]|uniref:FOG: Leucine rich repeat n=1 Tax=Plasmopara halstedii TaxID=4781 RepID=A0A0P1ABP2_PLAHL|nr:FOG: Leucine rich repeat [Plasmopara halstedii]CEG37872.1 FOG: Leucine rich repeat [Plasmopara halstedii]|eukprot:XP_024574241.1 FOG: Leucine rich repeat [Plasmopara halstedii]
MMSQRDISLQIQEAKKHGMLHLIQYQLTTVPPDLFSKTTSGAFLSSGLTAPLIRVDLSFNHLEGPHAIPDTIGSLATLRELYVNNNPRLTHLPSSLVHCNALQVLDASSTGLVALPPELSRLQNLHFITIDNTPLQSRWEVKGLLLKKNEANSIFISLTSDTNAQQTNCKSTSTMLTPCQQILQKLRRKDEREQLKRELYNALRDSAYRLQRLEDSAAASAVLQTALRRVLKQFPKAVEIRSLLRNAERLFPRDFSIEIFENLDAAHIRNEFDVLQTAIERKKRAADLELIIRNLYGNQINLSTAEQMVRHIYDHIPQLSDIKFLVKHASRLFPKDVGSVDGKQIQTDLINLQQRFAQERAAALDKLQAAVRNLYNEDEPANVRELVTSVAQCFKNTKELLSLAADASKLFPAEILDANAVEIRASFLRIRSDIIGEGRGHKPA